MWYSGPSHLMVSPRRGGGVENTLLRDSLPVLLATAGWARFYVTLEGELQPMFGMFT